MQKRADCKGANRIKRRHAISLLSVDKNRASAEEEVLDSRVPSELLLMGRDHFIDETQGLKAPTNT